MSSSATLNYRLRPVPALSGSIRLSDEQGDVVTNSAARLRVLAGPGTGKTATLIEAVADRVEKRAVAPEQILVLTFSRRAARDLSGRIARRLGLTTRESMVRTLHSYAYSVVRRQAARAAEPSPRLLAADEADHMVRDLLAGHIAAGGQPWPAFLGRALSSPSFAAELREILLRAASSGITGQRMIELGRRHKRPEWVAVGQFAREYQQVSDLRQGISGLGVALDQAELTAAAVGALRQDEVLAAEQRRVRRIFVDEYQDVDPAQATLISMVSDGADELIVFGDPDQSIYAFRGAESTPLRDIAVDRTVSLTVSRRLAPDLVVATRRLARRLPGTAEHRRLRPGAPSDGVDALRTDSVASGSGVNSGHLAAPDHAVGHLDVKVFPSAAREAAYVADQLRRAHLFQGIPWDSMAILLRSPASGHAALSRACAVAGVPVAAGVAGDVLSDDPVVAALLTVLECGVDPAALNGDRAVELLSSPLAEIDVLGLRRIRRALLTARPGEGSSADLLAAVLAGAAVPETVSSLLRTPVHRVQELLATARAGASSPTAEQVLWDLWRACGLEQSLAAAVERGGSVGQRADRTLDAILGLFEMAADLAERVPLAGVAAFIAAVRGRQLPAEPRIGGPSDAVAIVSAHAAKGLQWDLVAVVGAQEGSWPDLRVRGSLLAGKQLVDLAVGIPTGSPAVSLLAEERRLFYVAATRSRYSLIATGVLNQDVTPSRFLSELAGAEGDLPLIDDASPTDGPARDRWGLPLTDLVADLRRAVTDPEADTAVAAAAARHLADLAASAVPGAHPDDWYGLGPRSTDSSPIPAGAEIRVSPSLVEALNTCALRAVLERRGGRGSPGQAQLEGMVVHAMIEGLAAGVADTELRTEIDAYLSADDRLAPWQLARTRRALLSMLNAAQIWMRENHPPRTLLGSELVVDVPLAPQGIDDAPDKPIRLVGRVDWLSARPDGRLIVTDFKTGASIPSRAETESNPQLAAYQAAVALGAFDHSKQSGQGGESTSSTPAGAELVYLRSGRPKVLQQSEMSATSTTQWLGSIRVAASQLAAATASAQENVRCERCPVRTSCPLQNEGRQVTR